VISLSNATLFILIYRLCVVRFLFFVLVWCLFDSGWKISFSQVHSINDFCIVNVADLKTLVWLSARKTQHNNKHSENKEEGRSEFLRRGGPPRRSFTSIFFWKFLSPKQSSLPSLLGSTNSFHQNPHTKPRSRMRVSKISSKNKDEQTWNEIVTSRIKSEKMLRKRKTSILLLFWFGSIYSNKYKSGSVLVRERGIRFSFVPLTWF